MTPEELETLRTTASNANEALHDKLMGTLNALMHDHGFHFAVTALADECVRNGRYREAADILVLAAAQLDALHAFIIAEAKSNEAGYEEYRKMMGEVEMQPAFHGSSEEVKP